jgi:predicted nucleotide-binding protein
MKIFVSFHDKDETLYNEIKNTLKQTSGVEVYRHSLDGLGPRRIFDPEALYERLNYPDLAIALLSPHYFADPWFDHELPALFALESHLKSDIILPVIAENVDDQQIPLYLRSRDYIDCRSSIKVGMGRLNEIVSQAHQRGMTKVFLVHGHDNEAKESVARFIERLGLEAVILHEQANRGRTIIEKLEHHVDAFFAVVLLTPDDVGASRKDSNSLQPRGRQNVIFELGLFIGKLGRSHVCALQKGAIELPSDYHGVLPLLMDEAGGWKAQLAQELKQAGCAVNISKALL